ncbi:WHG domain-containing protein [Alphaproteobacteria bacterium]|jgi:AcrR family transcriptional regulator|nr:WHG domain-containing protein [Alphaproteobacteria bacterium]
MKREEKKKALREGLIAATYRQIEQNGVANLRAREITAEAGCALGALYTAFADLNELIFYANSQTIKVLSEEMAKETETAGSAEGKLIKLAIGYQAFARAHSNLWLSLFEHTMITQADPPAWHLEQHVAIFNHIAEPLAGLFPDLEEREVLLRARTLFSAVHGVVSMSLQERFVAVPLNELERQLELLIKATLVGMQTE